MTKRVAINGLGRIGRLILRGLMNVDQLELVAINDIGALDNLAYLLKYDSVHTDPNARIEAVGDVLHWNDKEIKFYSERDPSALPWQQLGVDIVLEATGRFSKRDELSMHLQAGAKRVIITADARGSDTTIVMGVNEDIFDPAKDLIVSNASCTTNAVAPLVKVLMDQFGIVTAFLTTVHAYTSTQSLVDSPAKKDWRRGRAAAVSIIPASTGAAKATVKVIPELTGKLDGMAMRVPVAAGSIVDLVVQTEKPVTVDSVNQAFRDAAQSEKMKGFLGIADDPLVSADIVGSPYSSQVDIASTMTIGDHTVKVVSWYDNEWGYSMRVIDLAQYIAQRT